MSQGSGDRDSAPHLTAPDEWDRLRVYRLADIEGKPVMWRGQKISPDYRPGHTTHPEYAGRGAR